MSGKSTLKRAWSVRGHFTPFFTIFNRKWSSKTTGFQRDGKLKSTIHSAATTYESEWNIHEGSIPFTRSNVYGGFLTFGGFCISFASARLFPPPEMLRASCLFPALPFLSRTRGLGQFSQGKITCVGCADTQAP
jgi:hypothetical protein